MRAAIEWISLLEHTPLAYVDEDRTRVATGRQPYLEFGLHTWGSPSDMRVGTHRRVSTPGTLALMNAHFGNRGTPRQSWRFWCLSFDVSRTSPLPGVGEVPMLATASLRNPAAAAERYGAVARERASNGPGREARIKGSTMLLLGTLLDDLAPGPDHTVDASAPVHSAIELMQRQYRDPGLSLGAIAAAMHLSESHFGRLFRDETGVAPMKFLRDLRIARACELLRRTHLHVAEIAYDVGYSDPAYFSRLFHRQTGTSPRAYRQAPPPTA